MLDVTAIKLVWWDSAVCSARAHVVRWMASSYSAQVSFLKLVWSLFYPAWRSLLWRNKDNHEISVSVVLCRWERDDKNLSARYLYFVWPKNLERRNVAAGHHLNGWTDERSHGLRKKWNEMWDWVGRVCEMQLDDFACLALAAGWSLVVRNQTTTCGKGNQWYAL